MNQVKKYVYTLFVFVVSINCAKSEQVKLVSGINLTPDGDQVVFSWRGDVWSGPSNGGRITRLTAHAATDGYPCVSSDGKSIAFTSNRTGSEQTYKMSIDGGQPTQLTFHSEGSIPRAWFPDGKSLIVSGTRTSQGYRQDRLFRVDCQGEKEGRGASSDLVIGHNVRSGPIS